MDAAFWTRLKTEIEDEKVREIVDMGDGKYVAGGYERAVGRVDAFKAVVEMGDDLMQEMMEGGRRAPAPAETEDGDSVEVDI